MNHKRRMVMFVVGLSSITVLVAFIVAPATQVNADNRSEKLLGSWNAVVTTEIQGVTFPSLLTFTSDGSVIADEPPSSFETSGHGNWISTGPGQVAFTFMTLVGSIEGPLSAKYKVVGTLKLGSDKESWSGPFKIDIFDPNGQMIFTDHGTFSLTRIAVEPLR